MIKGTKTFYMDDEGVFHKAAEETFYFENEEQREFFMRAIEKGEVKLVTTCEGCKNWDHTALGWHRCKLSGMHMQFDDYCSRGERE